MPILSYLNNIWYGSASGAMEDTQPIIGVEAGIKGYARLNESVQITLPTEYLKPTRLVNSPLEVQGLGELLEATPKARARMALDVAVNILSQDDVTGAVLEAKIEGNYTLKEVLRILVAFVAGKTDIEDLGGGNATVKFRDLLDTKDRITGSMSGSERTDVTIDKT